MQRQLFRLSSLVLITTALLSQSTQAQQDVAFANGVPVAPTGLAAIKLGAGPWTYPTGEGMNIKVEVVARDIEYPMSMAFTPAGELLLVTRKGMLYSIANGKATAITGGPASVFAGESGGLGTVHGYIDIALHPDFAKNQWVYISYTKPSAEVGGRGGIAIGRGQLKNGKLENFADIWDSKGKVSGVTRLAFAKDGNLFVTTNGSDPQDLNTLGGKVLRLKDDGSVPSDNPYVGTPNTRPEVYSWGHRSALGLAVHPKTGALWESENGPNGGDELNVIKPKANYGWPKVSLGRDYKGPWQSEGPNHLGYEPPVVYWVPAIAVSGLLFYTGDALSKWKGDVFVGSLRTGEIPGTGHVERILLNEKMEELRRESLLTDLHQRVRDVRQGPDGFIYVATEQKDGAILRIMPAK